MSQRYRLMSDVRCTYESCWINLVAIFLLISGKDWVEKLKLINSFNVLYLVVLAPEIIYELSLLLTNVPPFFAFFATKLLWIKLELGISSILYEVSFKMQRILSVRTWECICYFCKSISIVMLEGIERSNHCYRVQRINSNTCGKEFKTPGSR